MNVEALAHGIADVPWSPDNAGRALSNEHSDADLGGPDALLATHSGPDAVSRRWPTAMLPLVG